MKVCTDAYAARDRTGMDGSVSSSTEYPTIQLYFHIIIIMSVKLKHVFPDMYGTIYWYLDSNPNLDHQQYLNHQLKVCCVTKRQRIAMITKKSWLAVTMKQFGFTQWGQYKSRLEI